MATILAGGPGRTSSICPLPAELVAVVVGNVEAAGHKLVCGGVCTSWRDGVLLPSAWRRTALTLGGALDDGAAAKWEALCTLVGHVASGFVHLKIDDCERVGGGRGFVEVAVQSY